MKKFILSMILIFIALFPVTAQTKYEKSVAAAVEEMRQAMIDADRTALEWITSEQLSYGHSGGLIEDKKDFIDKIVSGRSDFVTIDLTEQTITVSKKTAIVRHILKARTNDSGQPGEVQLRIMLVWQKQSGKWKLLARQAVKMS